MPWDGVVPGLGMRARPRGLKTWIVHQRLGRGVVKRTLAPMDAMLVADARAMIAEAEAGGGAPAMIPMMWTFRPTFHADCAERWTLATRRAHADGMHRFILPAFGTRRVDAIAAREVQNWFDDLAARKLASANRVLAVLSSLMKHAETLGLRPEGSNPCRGLCRRKSGFEARYLSDSEFTALGQALDEAEDEHPVVVTVFRFLLYTGARKSEALGLRWAHIHGDWAVLPDSKTGPKTIWLATSVRAVLAGLPRRSGCLWVFASDGKPILADKACKAIRERAGLGELRIHDLRHSYAAVAVGNGEGLRTVAGLLGHADIATTFGYAHLAEYAVFDVWLSKASALGQRRHRAPLRLARKQRERSGSCVPCINHACGQRLISARNVCRNSSRSVSGSQFAILWKTCRQLRNCAGVHGKVSAVRNSRSTAFRRSRIASRSGSCETCFTRRPAANRSLCRIDILQVYCRRARTDWHADLFTR